MASEAYLDIPPMKAANIAADATDYGRLRQQDDGSIRVYRKKKGIISSGEEWYSTFYEADFSTIEVVETDSATVGSGTIGSKWRYPSGSKRNSNQKKAVNKMRSALSENII